MGFKLHQTKRTLIGKDEDKKKGRIINRNRK
jgi:hypothetical protein